MKDELTAEELQALKVAVFKEAMEGSTEGIKASLSRLTLELVKEILHHHTPNEEGLCTPLTLAICFDYTCVVRLMVEEFSVDIEESATLDPSGQKCRTALFTAVQRRQLDMVKILVENGADVNELSEGEQTALQEACFSGNVEMVKYLCEESSRTAVVNEYNNTCLMMACLANSEDTVHYLLERGVNPNQSPHQSRQWMALHSAAQSNAGAIGELLMTHGAVMTKNKDGYTPLSWATVAGRTNFFDVVVRSPVTPREEKISGLELMAAACVLDDANAARQYQEETITERHRDPLCILRKPHRSAEPAVGNVVESQTLEELLARERDPTALKFECLLIAERILGPKNIYNSELHLLVCSDLASQNRISEATALWFYAKKAFRRKSRFEIFGKCILNVFDEAHRSGSSPPFVDAVQALYLTLEEAEEMVQRSPKDAKFKMYAKNNALIFLSFCKVALAVAQNDDHKVQLRNLMRRFGNVLPSLACIAFLAASGHHQS